MMTYIDWPQSVARSARQKSRPSITGISQSVMTICGRTSTATARASRPFSAVNTVQSRRCESRASVSMRLVGSSSTSSTRLRGAPLLAVGCGRGSGALAMASKEGSGVAGSLSNSAQSCQSRIT